MRGLLLAATGILALAAAGFGFALAVIDGSPGPSPEPHAWRAAPLGPPPERVTGTPARAEGRERAEPRIARRTGRDRQSAARPAPAPQAVSAPTPKPEPEPEPEPEPDIEPGPGPGQMGPLPALVSPNEAEQVVRSVLRGALTAFEACYEKSLRRDQRIRGRVVVNVAVQASGEIESARVVESNVRDEEVLGCIANRVRQVRFPPLGEDVDVTLPLALVPREM